MSDWRAKQECVHDPRGWCIYEYPDRSATRCSRLVASGLTEDDALRIARLLKLQADSWKIIQHDSAWRALPPATSPRKYAEMELADVIREMVAEIERLNLLKADAAAGLVDCGICSGPDCEGCSKETGT